MPDVHMPEVRLPDVHLPDGEFWDPQLRAKREAFLERMARRRAAAAVDVDAPPVEALETESSDSSDDEAMSRFDRAGAAADKFLRDAAAAKPRDPAAVFDDRAWEARDDRAFAASAGKAFAQTFEASPKPPATTRVGELPPKHADDVFERKDLKHRAFQRPGFQRRATMMNVGELEYGAGSSFSHVVAEAKRGDGGISGLD